VQDLQLYTPIPEDLENTMTSRRNPSVITSDHEDSKDKEFTQGDKHILDNVLRRMFGTTKKILFENQRNKYLEGIMSDVIAAIPKLVVGLAPSGTTITKVKQFCTQIKIDWERAKARETSLPSSVPRTRVRRRTTSSVAEKDKASAIDIKTKSFVCTTKEDSTADESEH
jgi:hypothetical protein